MMKHCTIAMISLFVCLLPAVAQEGPAVKRGENLVEVTVTGSGTSKDEAIRDAKRKAIERAAGTFIYSQSNVQDFVLKKDTVLARAAGFVQAFEVTSTKESEDGIVTVTAKATVSVKGIEDTWGVVTNLLQEQGRPKIMVAISERMRDREKRVDETVEESTVQTKVQDLLLKAGFLLVDKNQLKEIDKKDLAAAVAEDSAAKVQAIAKRFGAQIFLTGAANAMPGAVKDINGVTFHTYEAEANVKVYRSDTAQIMSAVAGVSTRGVQQVWRSAGKQALDLQAQQVAPRIVEDVCRFWLDAMQGRGEVQLQVEGLTFADYVKLKKALEGLKQIKQVNAKFSNGVAECSLQSEVNAEQLGEKIVETIKTLDITDVSQNVIKAKYKKE